MQIAQTILQQLGGNRFIAMVGARNLASVNGNALSFKVGRNSKGVTHVMITLAPADLYTVETFKCRGMEIAKLATVENVYAENLREVFTAQTGLDTSL